MLNQKLLKSCPYCGGVARVNYVELSGLFYVGCSHCVYKACYCPTESQAVRAWNEQTEAVRWN